jgi:hypothetical protein
MPDPFPIELRRCRGAHWFAYYGHPGSSSPFCVRCGAPNPRYDKNRDLYLAEKPVEGGSP